MPGNRDSTLEQVATGSRQFLDKVLFGSTITLLNLDNDQIMKIQLVGEHEADIKSGKMSITAPIARACIGKEMGDVAEVETPNGMAEYSIEKIEYI